MAKGFIENGAGYAKPLQYKFFSNQTNFKFPAYYGHRSCDIFLVGGGGAGGSSSGNWNTGSEPGRGSSGGGGGYTKTILYSNILSKGISLNKGCIFDITIGQGGTSTWINGQRSPSDSDYYNYGVNSTASIIKINDIEIGRANGGENGGLSTANNESSSSAKGGNGGSGGNAGMTYSTGSYYDAYGWPHGTNGSNGADSWWYKFGKSEWPKYILNGGTGQGISTYAFGIVNSKELYSPGGAGGSGQRWEDRNGHRYYYYGSNNPRGEGRIGRGSGAGGDGVAAATQYYHRIGNSGASGIVIIRLYPALTHENNIDWIDIDDYTDAEKAADPTLITRNNTIRVGY